MKHEAVATTTMRLEPLTITHGDGSQTYLGQTGTLAFWLRVQRLRLKYKLKGLI